MSTNSSEPISVNAGELHSFTSDDHPTVDGFHVSRIGGVYPALASVSIGSATALFGADGVPLSEFATVMAGPRWSCAGDFLVGRYGEDLVLDEMVRDEQAEIVVGHDFTAAPSEAEVLQTLWPTAHAVVTDAADHGGMPAQMREHLDEQAYIDTQVTKADEDTVAWLVVLNKTTGEPLTDSAALALAGRLAAEPDAPACYRQLLDRRYASRSELADAVDQLPEAHRASARALAHWAQAQPTTSQILNLLRTLPRDAR